MPTLHVVATPIGNLADITVRALQILTDVDRIACEDTRQTLKLLNHYQIKNRLLSYHGHNERQASAKIVRCLDDGEDIALVSDAGTPGISDPGSIVVQEVRRAGYSISPVPGPSAPMALLSVSGASTRSISFAGFLSSKRGRRRKQLCDLLAEKRGIVMFESPHRVRATLEQINEIDPDRKVLLGREMTKYHEEFVEGVAADLLTLLSERGKILGELTLFLPVAPGR